MPRPKLTKQEREIKELRKYLRQSQAAMPAVLLFGAMVFGVLFVIDLFLSVRWWVYALFLWVVPFGLIGDGVNILYIRRKLARLQALQSEPADSRGRPT